MERQSRITEIQDKHESCNMSSRNHIIFGTKGEGGFLLMNKHKNIQNLYVNQMFYYFDSFNNSEKIKKPCGIIKIYGNSPNIQIKPYESTFEAPKVGNYHKINLLDTNQQTIEVVLDMAGNVKYYQGEKINLKRMKYVKGEPDVIENYATSITSNFTINGYEIVELIYYSPLKNSYHKISKLYYFVPSEKNFIIKEEIISYFQNNTSIKPNCSIYYLNIEYLDFVDYNGTKGSIQTLNSTDGIKGKFKIDKTSIIFDEMEDGKTTISCTYKTLDGSITTTTRFVMMDMIVKLGSNKQQLPNDTRFFSTSTTQKSRTMEKGVDNVGNKAIKQTEIFLGISMLLLLFILQM
uniref:6-cysteine protein n=1 Tax=Strongyloides venezuelensis TaxID=75913 RepID=A0A0K0FD68_STRVS